MQTLYLKEQGSKLGCSGRRLVVTKDDQELLTVPIHRLTRVVLIGRVQVTTQAMSFLLDRRIPLVMTTLNGRLRGVLVPPDTPHKLKHSRRLIRSAVSRASSPGNILPLWLRCLKVWT